MNVALPGYGHAHTRREPMLAAWVFALALFGYPVVAAVVSFLQIDSRVLSVPFRLAVAVFCIALLARSRPPQLGGARSVLWLVWTAYTLRLLHDHFVARIDGADYALLFFLAGALLPATALLARGRWDQTPYAWLSLGMAVSALVAFQLGERAGLLGDSSLTVEAGRLSTVALNPVSLGHLCVSALLCATALWQGTTRSRRWLLAAIIALAMTTLLATGSKGPALALGVCLLVWALRHLSARWPALLFVVLIGLFMGAGSDNPLLERLTSTSEDLSTLDRLVLIENSLAQIEASPLLGSAFVEFESGFYPHNIVLEAALALGIPMATVLVLLLLHGVRLAWRAMGSADESLLGMLYFQAVVDALLTGGMYGTTLLWVSLALLLRPRARRPVTRTERPARALPVAALSEAGSAR